MGKRPTIEDYQTATNALLGGPYLRAVFFAPLVSGTLLVNALVKNQKDQVESLKQYWTDLDNTKSGVIRGKTQRKQSFDVFTLRDPITEVEYILHHSDPGYWLCFVKVPEEHPLLEFTVPEKTTNPQVTPLIFSFKPFVQQLLGKAAYHGSGKDSWFAFAVVDEIEDLFDSDKNPSFRFSDINEALARCSLFATWMQKTAQWFPSDFISKNDLSSFLDSHAA